MRHIKMRSQALTLGGAMIASAGNSSVSRSTSTVTPKLSRLFQDRLGEFPDVLVHLVLIAPSGLSRPPCTAACNEDGESGSVTVRTVTLAPSGLATRQPCVRPFAGKFRAVRRNQDVLVHGFLQSAIGGAHRTRHRPRGSSRSIVALEMLAMASLSRPVSRPAAPRPVFWSEGAERQGVRAVTGRKPGGLFRRRGGRAAPDTRCIPEQTMLMSRNAAG